MNLLAVAEPVSDTRRLQEKTEAFVQACFPGPAPDPVERGLRALEEMLELSQALGVTQALAQRLLDYVYGRPVGEIRQELGGAVLTLSAVASAVGANLADCWEAEVDRVSGRIEQVREKHRFKETQGIVAPRQPLDTAWFTTVVEKLKQAGFASEDIAWSEGLAPPESAKAFAYEAIFVICNSGMQNDVARGIYNRVMVALESGQSATTAFRHPGKSAAIDGIWKEREALFAAYQAAEDKLVFCGDLPWIGNITKYHLAKNFGVDVAKPDRHLMRLGAVSGETAQTLCERLGAATALRAATVDVLLWRACANGIVDPHTGEVRA